MAIVSFRHNFIFIKTTKTAGTSIEVDLSGRLEEEAIVTPILPPVPGHRARNFADAGGKTIYYNHMPAQEIADLLGAERFGAMFRFCVEREPVEKCISHFHMLRNSALHNPDGAYDASWESYCEAGNFPVDHYKYSRMENGRRVLMVNRVLRYDRLKWALPRILDRRGIAEFQLHTRAKSEFSKTPLIRKDQVTTAQRQRIYEAFAPTLAVTGIKWNS